jgi:hypothetical protein
VLAVCRRPGFVPGYGQSGREVQVEHGDARQRGQVLRRARPGTVGFDEPPNRPGSPTTKATAMPPDSASSP